MSKPIPIRSKRPLSPTADTSIADRRKMLRANYEHTEDDKKILSLTSNQHTQIIRQLIDSNPAAREAILALVPSLPPIPTQSRFFASEVEELASFLSGEQGSGGPRGCSFWKDAVESTIQRMGIDLRQVDDHNRNDDKFIWHERLSAIHGPEKSKRLNYADGSRDDYLMDMFIAIIDISLLISQRVPFANFKMRHHDTAFCPMCQTKCPYGYGNGALICGAIYLAALIDSIISAWHVEFFVYVKNWTGDWILALLYESPDGSSHPFRSAVSRYIELPPLLPPKSPNDPWTVNDPLVRSLTVKLRGLLKDLSDLVIQGKVLATEPSSISGLDDLALSDTDTSSPVQPENN